MKRISNKSIGLGLAIILGLLAAGPAGATTDSPAISPALQRLISSVTAANAPRMAVVRNVEVIETGENYATLAWETDTPVTEEVYYGYFPSQELPMMTLQTGTRHRMTLGTLLRGTEYHYRIAGKDDASGTFTTAGLPPPLYEARDLVFLDPRTVQFTWRTSVPTVSMLGYRRETESDYLTLATDPNPAWDHQHIIAGLAPETKYYCIIESTDSSGYKVNTGERWFVTPENNVALRQPVTGTFTAWPADASVRRDSEPLRRVTDGDGDYFTGMATSGEVTAETQWVTVDLGREYPLDRVITVWRSLAYPKAFRLEVSRDGLDFSALAGPLDAGGGVFGHSESGTPQVTLTTPGDGRRGRYVRLIVPRGSPCYQKHAQWKFVQLMELKAIPRDGE